METEAEEILQYWLHDVGPERWYEADDRIDAEITQRFEGLWRRARNGGCDRWITTPRGALALLILLDQFPRNMFRGTAAAFWTDCKARRIAKQAIRMGHDAMTPEPERQFFYLPLMHSEGLPDQERCVRLIKLSMSQTANKNLEHARRHRDVIRRFGRFPSRNHPLGRRDTEAERTYRAGGGYMA